MKNIISKIINWLNGIGADKYKHIALGEYIAAIVIVMLDPFMPKWIAAIISAVVVYAAAVTKEKIDPEFDRYDILATSLGGLMVWIAYLV